MPMTCARDAREAGGGSQPALLQERIKRERPKAIILSGGPNSVHTANAPQLPLGFYEYVQQEKIPVLGVCYGMQLLVHVSFYLLHRAAQH